MDIIFSNGRAMTVRLNKAAGADTRVCFYAQCGDVSVEGPTIAGLKRE